MRALSAPFKVMVRISSSDHPDVQYLEEGRRLHANANSSELESLVWWTKSRKTLPFVRTARRYYRSNLDRLWGVGNDPIAEMEIIMMPMCLQIEQNGKPLHLL
jgi:hypothetical protein